MVTTTTRSTDTSAHSWLTLSTGIIVESDDAPRHHVTQHAFGIYRATKSIRLINECADLINRGGIAALIPVSASDAYLEAIAEQIELFARTRTEPGGILALPTSGSTGTPKLVAIPASGLAQFLGWGEEHFGFDETTISLSLSPWNFDVSLLDTWAVLSAGGTVVAADTARLYDTNYLTELLHRHRPTFVQVVPATLDALVNLSDADSYDTVHDVVLTGGVASQSLRTAATRLFPQATFHNIYGSTEVNDCLIETLSAEKFAGADSLPLGRPINGCEVFLGTEDEVQRLDPQMPDTEGELLVRTPWMALGYIHEGAIRPLPTRENHCYPMRDHASWSAQQLRYLGRYDRTVKIRGQRVSLDEIEQAARSTSLAEMACAWITEAGTNTELHMAYTTSSQTLGTPSSLALRMAMSAILPPFAMPNHLHPFDSPFPLNGNGKPDFASIKSLTESE